MKKTTTKITALMMASVLFMSGCVRTNTGNSRNENNDLPVNPDDFNTTIDYEDLDRCSFNEGDFNSDYNTYTFNLMSEILNNSDPDMNVMVSPASIMFAMDLAAAGANGDTLTQITNVFSEGADPMEQQAFAASMMDRINSSEEVNFSCANAVWTNRLLMSTGLNPDYQEYIEEHFDAEAFQEDFGMETVEEINSWIDDNTYGMIQHVLDDLEPDTATVLVNAIAFDGAWAEPYEDYQVQEMTFNTSSGDQIDVQMLCDSSYYYFENEEATGFIRSYEGGQYSLLVMQP